MAIELGGDKLTSCQFVLHKGKLEPIHEVEILYANNGQGYYARMQELAVTALKRQIPVGISFAGPLKGEEILATPNMQAFMTDFTKSEHQGNIRSLFPSFAKIINDAVATALTATVSVTRTNPQIEALLLIVMGSGLGGAVWKRNNLNGPGIIAAEPGHIPVIPDLNPFHQTKTCPLLENKYVCIENVAGGKAGIEDIYKQITNKYHSGFEISRLYQAGDPNATKLYDSSATLTAHVILGMLRSIELPFSKTTVALHGGLTLVPSYTHRVRQLLESESYTNTKLNLIETKKIAKHSGILGAATAAIAAVAQL